MVELSPFRVIVDLSAPPVHPGWRLRLEIAVPMPGGLFFATYDTAMLRYNSLMAEYPEQPPYLVVFEEVPGFNRYNAFPMVMGEATFPLTEPPDWEPVSVSNIDYYHDKYWAENTSSVTFTGRPPGEAHSYSPAAENMRDLRNFAIIAVELNEGA